MATCNWQGISGKSYAFDIYLIETEWNDVPGNYIFTQSTNQGWKACYIGETDSFKNRLPNHEQKPCAARNGATHVHAHTNHSGVTARKAEEADLIARWKPPCNDQLK